MSVECANIQHAGCADAHCDCFCHGRENKPVNDGRNLLWWLVVGMVVLLNALWKRLGIK